MRQILLIVSLRPILSSMSSQTCSPEKLEKLHPTDSFSVRCAWPPSPSTHSDEIYKEKKGKKLGLCAVVDEIQPRRTEQCDSGAGSYRSSHWPAFSNCDRGLNYTFFNVPVLKRSLKLFLKVEFKTHSSNQTMILWGSLLSCNNSISLHSICNGFCSLHTKHWLIEKIFLESLG